MERFRLPLAVAKDSNRPGGDGNQPLWSWCFTRNFRESTRDFARILGIRGNAHVLYIHHPVESIIQRQQDSLSD